MYVYAAGISVKVKVHYPGRSHFAHESGTVLSRNEKSAEGIVGTATSTEGPNLNFDRS